MLRLAAPRDSVAVTAREWTTMVHHGGRTFMATETMANIFSAHAQDLRDRGETELVPLLHRDGVDLLLIGPHTAYAVVPVQVGEKTTTPTTRTAPASLTTRRAG